MSNDETGWFAQRRAKRNQRREGSEAIQPVVTAALGNPKALTTLPALLEAVRPSWPSQKAFNSQLIKWLSAAAREVIADDLMTADEEAGVRAVGSVMGMDTWLRVNGEYSGALDVIRYFDYPLWEDLIIARLNTGWLPEDDSKPPILLRANESHLGTWDAKLLREKVVKEYQGESSGGSIGLPLGIRVGGSSSRGRTVEIARYNEAVDRGSMVVTTLRTVFKGEKESLEVPHERLLSVELFTDGLRLAASGSSKNPLISVSGKNTSALLAVHVIRAAAEARRNQ